MLNEKVKKKEEEKKNQSSKASGVKTTIEVKTTGTKANGTQSAGEKKTESKAAGTKNGIEVKVAGTKTATANTQKKAAVLPEPSTAGIARVIGKNGTAGTSTRLQKDYTWSDYIDDVKGGNTKSVSGPVSLKNLMKYQNEAKTKLTTGSTNSNTAKTDDKKQKSALEKWAEQGHEDYFTAPGLRPRKDASEIEGDYLNLKATNDGGRWAGIFTGEDGNILRSASPRASYENSNAWLQTVDSGIYDTEDDYTLWSRGKLRSALDENGTILKNLQNRQAGSAKEKEWAKTQITADEDLMDMLNNGIPLYESNGVNSYQTGVIKGKKPDDYDLADITKQADYDAAIYNAVHGVGSYSEAMGLSDATSDKALQEVEGLWNIIGSDATAEEKFRQIRGYDYNWIQGTARGKTATDYDQTVKALEQQNGIYTGLLDAQDAYFGELDKYQAWKNKRIEDGYTTGAEFVDRYGEEGREDTQDVDAIMSFVMGGKAWNDTLAGVAFNQMAGGRPDESPIFEGYDYGYYTPPEIVDAMMDYYTAEDYDSVRAIWEATKPMRQNQHNRQEKNRWTYASDEFPILNTLMSPIVNMAGSVSGTINAIANAFSSNPIENADGLLSNEWVTYVRSNIQNNAKSEVTRLTGSEFLGNAAAGGVGVINSVTDNALQRGVAGLFAGANEIGNIEQRAKQMKAITLGLMGMSVFANDYTQTLNETKDNAYATVHGILSAMLELSTETWLSADALFSTDTYGIDYFKNVVLGEGAEEVTGAVIEPFMQTALDNFYYGYLKGQGKQQSAWEQDAMSLYWSDPQKYTGADGVMDWGACLRDAMAMYGLNILESGIAGAAGAVGDAAIGAYQVTGEYSRAGKAIRANDANYVNDLATMAGGMINNKEAQALGKEIRERLEKGKNVSDKMVGRLYEVLYNGTSGEMADTIRDVLDRTAGETDYSATKKQLDEALSPLNARMAAMEKMAIPKAALTQAAKDAVDSASSRVASNAQIRAAGIAENQTRGRTVYEYVDPETGDVTTWAGTILRKEGDNYIVRDDKGEDHAIDVTEARAADPVTAATMKYAETTKAEDDLATGMLQAVMSKNVTEKNVGEVLQGAQDMFVRGILDRVTSSAEALKQVQDNLGMDAEAAETLYKAGSQAAQAWEETRVQNAMERGSTLNPGKGRVTYGKNVNLDEMTDTRRKQVEGLAALAEKVGFNVEFINDTENKGVYGEYNPATGSVIINIAGESSLQKSHHIMVTAGHELTHLLESQSGNGYAELRSFIFNEMKRNGVDIAARVQKKMDNYNLQIAEMRKRGENHADITLSEAMAEVVADASDQVLGNEKLINQLANENPSLFQKVKNFVKDFVQKIRAATMGMEDSRSKDSRWIRDLDTLAEKWGIAFSEIGENTRITENNGENTTKAEENIKLKLAEPDVGEYNKTNESEVSRSDEQRAGEIRTGVKSFYRPDGWALGGQAKVSIVRGDYSGIVAPGRPGYELFESALRGTSILSKKGAPIIWYHGSEKSFSEFENQKQKNRNFPGSHGHYFTSSVSVADMYASANTGKGYIYPAGIYAKNNIEFTAREFDNNFKMQNNALEIVEQIHEFVKKQGMNEKLLTAINRVMNHAVSTQRVSNDVAGKIMDFFATRGDIDSVTVKDAVWDNGEKNNQLIVFSNDNIVPATAEIWEKMDAEERKTRQNKNKTSLSEELDTLPVKTSFSVDEPVEVNQDGLVAVHNLSTQGLLSDIRMGGFPMPSIAVVRQSKGWNDYGDISLIFDRYTVDPQLNGNARLYGGDAYTPTLGSFDAEGDAQKALEYLRSRPERGVLGAIRRPAIPNFQRLQNIEQAREMQSGARYQNRDANFKASLEAGNRISEVLKGRIGNQGWAQERALAESEILFNIAALQMKDDLNYEQANGGIVTDTASLPETMNRYMMDAMEARGSQGTIGDRTEFFTAEDAQALQEYFDAIGQRFSDMQEAKPNEIVSFEHVKAAILPEGTELFLGDALEAAGIPYYTYKEGDGADRKRVMNDFVTEYGRTERAAEESVLFSLQEDSYGQKYVTIDTDQAFFDNLDMREMPKAIAGYITKRFKGTIIGEGDQRAYVDRRAANEYARPAKKNLATDIYETKGRLAPELDNLMKAAEFVEHQDNKPGRHPENTGGWDVYRVRIYNPTNGQYYEGKINTEYVEKGKRFHDLTDIKNVTASMQDHNALRSRQPRSGDIIAQETRNENIQSGQNQWSLEEADAEYMQAAEEGNEEKARELTEQAAREAGYTMRVYHGTPTGGFTQFRDWSYFTESKEYADRYQNPSASSIRGRYDEGTRKTYELFMNPGRVFDTRNAKEARIYNQARMEYGMGALTETDTGLPDWTNGGDLVDFIEENDLPYDTIILDEGADGGYGEEVKKRGLSYVSRNTQIKSAEAITYDENGDIIHLSERFNTENPDIRYSIDEGAPGVNDWIMGLDPKDLTGDSVSFFNTKGTRELIRNYQKLTGEIQETQGKISGMRAQLQEAKGDEARKLRINIQTETNKLNRLQTRMNDLTGKQDFGWLMQRAQETIDTFMRGKTQEEVNKSVTKLKNEAKRMRTTAEEASRSLERLAEREDNVIAHSMLNPEKLAEAARKVKELNGGLGDIQTIEDGVGEIAMRLLNGDGEGTMEATNRLIDRLFEADWRNIRFNMMGGRRFEAGEIQGELRTGMQSDILSAAADALQGVYDGSNDSNRVDSLINYVSQITKNTRQTARGMTKVAQLAEDMQKLGDQVTEASEKMKGDLKRAIHYFDMVNQKNRAEATARQIEEVTAALESKAAQRLIQEQQKWADRIATDKRVRQQTEENRALRKKINTAYTRVAKLILNESDLKNATEEMKPAARAAIRMILDNDVNGMKKITGVDYQTLLRAKQTMDAIDRRDGTDLHLDEIVDLDGEKDDDLREAIQTALDDIRRGVDFYQGGGRGRGQSALEADRQALEQIQKGMSTIYDIVSRSGQIFIEGKRVNTANMAYEVDTEARKNEAYREWQGALAKGARGLHNLWLKNTTPEYFFKNLKNNGMDQIYNEFKRAEDRYGRLLLETKDKVEAIAEKAGYATWDTDGRTEITLESGRKVKLTLEQMMSLYATWNREQQLGPEVSSHLMKGGFVFEEKSDTKILGREAREIKPYRVTQTDMLQIESSLTEAQREYVNSMVEILSRDMAAIGNEASMRMYGIRKYNEKYYFPFAVWEGVKNKASNAGSGVNPTNNNRAAHYSFTNRRVSGANNAVYLMDFTKVCAEHINQMTTYATMGGAIEGMNRVLNFRVAEDATDPNLATERNIESILRQQYGQDAVSYIRQFMKDLNGGAVQENGGFSNTLMSLFKKNAVGGSLSVALQQPLSYIRASTMINVKYLAAAGAAVDARMPTTALGGLAKGATGKSNALTKYWENSYNEMLAHSGVAVIKDMGRFDMNFSQGAVDWISPDQKERGIRKVYSKVENATNALPEKMDQYTWVKMWTALKMEQHDLHREMDITSDEFLDMVGERFNDVMRKTQVYDSVLVKSQLMRNQGWYAKTITAFRAEPTLSLNLFIDAFKNVKEKGGKKNLAAVISTFLISAIAQAAVKGIMSAGRSPDEKKTLAENFAYRFGYSFIGEANPLSLIPGYDNLIDALSGNDINDNAWGMISTFADSLVKIWNPPTGEDATIQDGYRYIEDTVGQITQMFSGIPAKNLMRDSRAIYNWFLAPYANREHQEKDKKTGEMVTIAGRASSGAVMRMQLNDLISSEDLIGLINGRLEGAIWDKSTNAYYDRIYAAEKAEDEARAGEMREYLQKGKGTVEKTINSAVATRAKNDEDMTSAEAAEWLIDKGYMDSTSWITSQFKEGEITEAEMRNLYARYFPTKNPDETIWNYWRQEWKEGEITESEAMEKYRTYHPGKKEADVLDYFWGDYRDQYKEGVITESEAMKLYQKYHPEKTEQDMLDYFWKDKWTSYKEGKITESEAMKLYDQYHPGDTEKQKNAAFWELYKQDYVEGTVDRKTAEKAYRKYYPKATEEDIWWVFDELDYKKETGKTASGQYYRVHDAIETNKSDEITKAVEQVMKHGKKKSGVLSSIEGKWKDVYLAMKDGSPEKVKLKDALIKALKAAGFTASAAERKINNWKPDKEDK